MNTIFTELEEEKLLDVLENPTCKNLSKCTVKELGILCKDQSLKRSGVKRELINRLLKHLHPDLTQKVWTICMGETTCGKCYCCWKNKITADNFHLRFIFKKRGIELNNLLPICKVCNSQIKSEDIDRYIKKNNLPLRRYGKDAPIGKYIIGIIWWQSLIRMWLDRKKLLNK